MQRSGAVALNSAVLKPECHNVGATERRSDGTSREMGGALAPPFEHLVYIYTHIHIHIHRYIYIYIHIHIHMHICTYRYTHIYSYTYKYKCA